MNNETYIDDNGIIHCSVCHAPKEKIVSSRILGGNHKVPLMCLCEQEKFEKEESERLERKRQSRILDNRSVCFHEKMMWEWNFANDNGSVPKMQLAKKYVEDWDKVYAENIGLLLWGGVGTGKTFIVTTNLTLEEIKYLKKTNIRYGRIYDRMLDICKPIKVDGESKRKSTGQHRMDILTDIFKENRNGKEGEAHE